MSNLGAYQWMTTAAKRVGGPVNLLILAGTTGAAIYKGSEIVVKQCLKTIKTRKATKLAEAKKVLYEVTLDSRSNEGLEFVVGDKFRVLEADGDSVLIEKIGDTNNPYFVSAEILRRISDYKE